MRVKFTQHIPDRACGFFVLGTGRQAKFGHRVNNPALHRFEAVTNMRQGAIKNDIHGIIQVRLFGKTAQGLLLDTLVVQLQVIRHRRGGW